MGKKNSTGNLEMSKEDSKVEPTVRRVLLHMQSRSNIMFEFQILKHVKTLSTENEPLERANFQLPECSAAC